METPPKTPEAALKKNLQVLIGFNKLGRVILRTFITFAKTDKAPCRVTPMLPERYTIIIYIEAATASILRIYHL
jgi:hypothetical protein